MLNDQTPTNYKKEGRKKCNNCNSRNYQDIIIDKVANIVCEEQRICVNCGEEIDYWGYGSWGLNDEPSDELLLLEYYSSLPTIEINKIKNEYAKNRNNMV